MQNGYYNMFRMTYVEITIIKHASNLHKQSRPLDGLISSVCLFFEFLSRKICDRDVRLQTRKWIVTCKSDTIKSNLFYDRLNNKYRLYL